MNQNKMDRLIQKIHDINMGPLSKPILVKRLKPLDQQTNYNSKLKEFFGPEEYDLIADTNGIFEAFKESEQWKEIGTLSMHDWKCSINDDIDIDTNCIVELKDIGDKFEVLFKREYIGEFVIGLRPVT